MSRLWVKISVPTRAVTPVKGGIDDDDNGFGSTVRYAPVVTEARYRKNALYAVRRP